MAEYEVGVDRGVFYPKNSPGEIWNGLTSVKENTVNADAQTRYVDGVKTHYRRRVGEFSGTIEAFTYPDSFFYDPLMQRRQKTFGMSYRVLDEDRYKIHLVYNISISPGGISRQQSETEPFQWDFTTTPIQIPGVRMSSHLVIDTTKAYSSAVAMLEDILYGSEVETPRLPSPEEVLEIFEINSILRVVDNGDGTATITGPDSVIQALDLTTYQITWPSVIQVGPVTYEISSL